MKFELGEVLKDIVTGFTGVAMVRAEYFTGCTHYGLQPQSLKDEKPINWEWIDESQLVKVKGAEKVERERTGESGPFPKGPQM
ncbi:hypothetical protein LCGC14_0944690 [marine sediment metagenome]|uniref:Uncharacterized protein n=1 Tax=marine sediment metagenome TaxID=412755 RepID=A0A0F9NNR2_9ZZZZ